MKKLPLAAFISTIAAFSSMTHAHQAGDIILRAGAAHVAPSNVSSSTITKDSSSLGAKVDSINSNTQLGLTGTYMLTDNIGIELLAATPFKHTIKGKGGTLDSLGISELGTTKHLPPTLSVQYFPLDNDSKFQPYVGVGLNYTNFFSEEADDSLTTTLGQEFDLELKNSWGVAAQAGLDYEITDNIMVNAAIWYIDIKTEATFTGKNDGSKIEADNVSIDPLVYMLGIGYKF
ncbi:outer membrane beta-barrel protein [Endozoicomonas sp. Mp262]|uniref:OmpW/AlkL family protein n=1 Tax=Endozoicomonas sp. Mp262 TaxID=2919499 RepID=UPI0021DB41F1